MLPREFPKIVSGGLALVCLGVGCRSGAPSRGHAVIHSDAHYACLFGQSYRTKIDLYVFFFTHEPDYKFIGTRAGNSGFGPKDLPAEITRQNIGLTFANWGVGDMGDIVILDVAPAGSVLTVRAETHDVTPLSGIRGSGGYPMGFICDLSYGGKTNSVFSEFIQSHKAVTGKVPNEDISAAAADKIK